MLSITHMALLKIRERAIHPDGCAGVRGGTVLYLTLGRLPRRAYESC